MKLVAWFTKSVKRPSRAPDDATNPSAIQQGNYTDYTASPYSIRMQMSPMNSDEMEAFEFVMNKMQAEHPECVKQSDLIDWGLDTGWLYTGKQGELRVSEVAPS